MMIKDNLVTTIINTRWGMFYHFMCRKTRKRLQ